MTHTPKYLYFLSEIPLLFNENTSTFRKKYLYFSEEVLLLLKGSTLTSRKKYLYFLPNVILLFGQMLYLLLVGSYITFCGGYMTTLRAPMTSR